jgi:hypothetical protein
MVGTPEYLLGTKMYDHRINSWGKALIGHCRKRTLGEINYENAHPFQHGTLTGVHNGSLRGIIGMPYVKDFGTDSEWLYYMASQEGMETVLEAIDFCGALVWWDSSDDTLNFFRNDERPLYVTYSEDTKVMLWASEQGMFWPFFRDFKLWDGGEKKQLYIPVETGKIFSYKIASHGKKASDIFTMSVKPVKLKETGVRGYAGNRTAVTGVRGKTGVCDGGSVVPPFPRQDSRAAEFLRLVDGGLDDPLPGELERGDPGLPLQLPALINNRGGSTTTHGSERKSSKSSSQTSDSGSDTKGSNNGRKPILSLASLPSNTSQPDNNAVTLIGCHDSSDNSIKRRGVSFRTILGTPFISCRKTNREWTEQTFEDATEGVCCHCKSPIGDLEEVHEIFIRKNKAREEHVSFVCQSCVQPTRIVC